MKKNKLSVNLTKNLVKTIQTETVGTAMYQTAQEFLLAVESILEKDFNFSEADIKKMEKKLIKVLGTLGPLERQGLSILNPRDMGIVVDIAQTRYNRLKKGKKPMALPERVKFLQVLNKPKPRRRVN